MSTDNKTELIDRINLESGFLFASPWLPDASSDTLSVFDVTNVQLPGLRMQRSGPVIELYCYSQKFAEVPVSATRGWSVRFDHAIAQEQIRQVRLEAEKKAHEAEAAASKAQAEASRAADVKRKELSDKAATALGKQMHPAGRG